MGFEIIGTDHLRSAPVGGSGAGGTAGPWQAVTIPAPDRTVCQLTGEIADAGAAGLAETLTAERPGTDKLEEARAEVAHYADLNHVLAQALVRATDTAKNAVAQEQALQEEFDEFRRDSQQVWERAVRADEFERKYHAAQAELESVRGIVAAARGIR